MKFIKEYILFEMSYFSEDVWIKRISNFMNHYYRLFNKNNNEFLPTTTLQFQKNGSKYKVADKLITLILQSEFERKGNKFKLRFIDKKPTKEDKLYYYRIYNDQNTKQGQKWKNNQAEDKLHQIRIDDRERYKKYKEDPDYLKNRAKQLKDRRDARKIEDPEWAEEQREKDKNRAQKIRDEKHPSYLKQLEKHNKKYAEDPEFRKLIAKRSQERYQEKRKDKKWVKRQLKLSREWYHKNKDRKFLEKKIKNITTVMKDIQNLFRLNGNQPLSRGALRFKERIEKYGINDKILLDVIFYNELERYKPGTFTYKWIDDDFTEETAMMYLKDIEEYK